MAGGGLVAERLGEGEVLGNLVVEHEGRRHGRALKQRPEHALLRRGSAIGSLFTGGHALRYSIVSTILRIQRRSDVGDIFGGRGEGSRSKARQKPRQTVGRQKEGPFHNCPFPLKRPNHITIFWGSPKSPENTPPPRWHLLCGGKAAALACGDALEDADEAVQEPRGAVPPEEPPQALCQRHRNPGAAPRREGGGRERAKAVPKTGGGARGRWGTVMERGSDDRGRNPVAVGEW